MIEINDLALRREIQARLERDREFRPAPANPPSASTTWDLIAHAAHLAWLLSHLAA